MMTHFSAYSMGTSWLAWCRAWCLSVWVACMCGHLGLLANEGVPSGPRYMTFADYIAMVRSGSAPSVLTIYCGGVENSILKLLKERREWDGVPLVVVTAKETTRSPISGQQVTGQDIWNLYFAAAGTFVLVDHNGHPIPLAHVPQTLHGGDPDIVTAHLTYFLEKHVEKMSFPEYVKAIGLSEKLRIAALRFKHGFFGRVLTPMDRVVRGVLSDGEVWDPWEQPGRATIISERPFGAATKNLVESLMAHRQSVGAPTLIVPAGADLASIHSAYPEAIIAVADLSAIRVSVSPRLVITTGLPPHGHGRGIEIWGWFPFSAFAHRFGFTPVPVLSDPDLPIGELDAGIMPLFADRYAQNAMWLNDTLEQTRGALP